jgi:hypothetical protein
MSNIAMQGGDTGTGTVSIVAPSTSTNRTLTLPDSTGTVATAESTLTQFNASGSAPVYACRAWVNFNGTGTVAIRASGNVSSITDGGTGNYTVNFTTAMQDANYTVTGGAADNNGGTTPTVVWLRNQVTAPTTSAVRIGTRGTSNSDFDSAYVNVAIFR